MPTRLLPQIGEEKQRNCTDFATLKSCHVFIFSKSALMLEFTTTVFWVVSNVLLFRNAIFSCSLSCIIFFDGLLLATTVATYFRQHRFWECILYRKELWCCMVLFCTKGRDSTLLAIEVRKRIYFLFEVFHYRETSIFNGVTYFTLNVWYTSRHKCQGFDAISLASLSCIFFLVPAGVWYLHNVSVLAKTKALFCKLLAPVTCKVK